MVTIKGGEVDCKHRPGGGTLTFPMRMVATEAHNDIVASMDLALVNPSSLADASRNWTRGKSNEDGGLKRKISNNKVAETVKRGMQTFRRLEAEGFLVLHGQHGEQYSLTESGKARVSSLMGHPCVIPLSRLPHLISALEAWLLRHQDDDSDDYALLMATATLMQENGVVRLRLGGWK